MVLKEGINLVVCSHVFCVLKKLWQRGLLQYFVGWGYYNKVIVLLDLNGALVYPRRSDRGFPALNTCRIDNDLLI